MSIIINDDDSPEIIVKKIISKSVPFNSEKVDQSAKYQFIYDEIKEMKDRFSVYCTEYDIWKSSENCKTIVHRKFHDIIIGDIITVCIYNPYPECYSRLYNTKVTYIDDKEIHLLGTESLGSGKYEKVALGRTWKIYTYIDGKNYIINDCTIPPSYNYNDCNIGIGRSYWVSDKNNIPFIIKRDGITVNSNEKSDVCCVVPYIIIYKENDTSINDSKVSINMKMPKCCCDCELEIFKTEDNYIEQNQ